MSSRSPDSTVNKCSPPKTHTALWSETGLRVANSEFGGISCRHFAAEQSTPSTKTIMFWVTLILVLWKMKEQLFILKKHLLLCWL